MVQNNVRSGHFELQCIFDTVLEDTVASEPSFETRIFTQIEIAFLHCIYIADNYIKHF